jgi:hypothetical protein
MSTVVLVSLLESASPAISSTMTDTATRPSTQPAAKADPVVRARGVPSMRITATIGIGLRATPTADGRRSPIASPSMGPPSMQPTTSIVRRPPARILTARGDGGRQTKPWRPNQRSAQNPQTGGR